QPGGPMTQRALLYRRAVAILCLVTIALVLAYASRSGNIGKFLNLSYSYEYDYGGRTSPSELSEARNFTLTNWKTIRSVAVQFAGANTRLAEQLFTAKEPVLTLSQLELQTPGGHQLNYEQLRTSIANATEPGLAPNIIHYVLPFRRAELQFHELLSLLAAFHLAKPLRVFLWHQQPVSGGYWSHLIANVTEPVWERTVVLARRQPPASVYNMPINSWRHRSDLIGLEAVLLFGGLRLDTDVLPMRPASRALRSAETVLGLQHDRGIGSSAYLAKRNSRFLLAWHLCYQLLDDSLPDQHSTLLPFALQSAFPHLAKIEIGGMHKPGWQAAGLRLIYGPPGSPPAWNWRDNWLINLWRRQRELQSPGATLTVDFNSVKQLNSAFGQIARHILFGNSSIQPIADARTAVSSTSAAVKPTPVKVADQVAGRDYVYAPMNKSYIISQFDKLKSSVRPFSGKYASRINELMVHKLPIVDTSGWRLHSPSGKQYTVAEVQAMTKPTAPYLVPNVAHYVLPFVNPQLQFHHLVCMLSGVWVMRPKFTVIWYAKQPYGEHWEAFKKNLTDSGIWESNVIMINRPVPTKSYSVPMRVKEHQADVIRMEAVLVLGGAYFDIDVVTLKPLEPLRRYPFTIGRETGGGLCNGVFLAAANSTFMCMWYVTYQVLDDGIWAAHSVTYPNTLCPMYSEHCHIEQESMDRPNWTGGELPLIYGPVRKWDWRKKNYVMHLWYRFHGKQYNMETIKYVDSTLGDMFRYVLYGNSTLVKKTKPT
uniref:Nucleotid_trans domain-containing protein n=2 Tax=Macrostomum lignano TaxID=282301 RepID=A0A1I8JBU2_9PLAT